MEKQIKFLLLSQATDSAAEILSNLERHPQFDVHFEPTAKRAVKYLAEGKIDCLILNIERFGTRQVPLIKQIRALGHNFRIFVFTEKAVLDAEAFLRLPNVMLFNISSIDLNKDLLGLCSRFLTGKGYPFNPARKARRFSTEQKGFVENVLTGRTAWSSVLNMSSTGAYLEMNTGSVNIGDLVKLTVKLEKLNKTRTVNGEIAWIGVSPKGREIAGFRFIKAGDFYIKLFAKF